MDFHECVTIEEEEENDTLHITEKPFVKKSSDHEKDLTTKVKETTTEKTIDSNKNEKRLTEVSKDKDPEIEKTSSRENSEGEEDISNLCYVCGELFGERKKFNYHAINCHKEKGEKAKKVKIKVQRTSNRFKAMAKELKFEKSVRGQQEKAPSSQKEKCRTQFEISGNTECHH